MAIAASPNPKASVSTPNKMTSNDKETEIDIQVTSEKPTKKKRNNNPGVRVIRGQIYDSENGNTCHQCRQKTYNTYVACKNKEMTKPCPLKYCRKCLLNRYGEKTEDVELLNQWDCPKCKGVCNCSLCMKKRGHQPTGMLVKMAKAGGFSSVSDLIDVKGAQNVSNYKRAKDTPVSSRKLEAAAEGIMITSPKKLGKENLFDGKTDSNADPQLSVPPPAEKKPKKMKRKGAAAMQDSIGVSDCALNDKKQKKVKSKVSKEIVGETTTNKPENEAEESTTTHDQNAIQHLEKPKKMKRKGAEVMQDAIGVSDHALNEKKQKKVKSKASKEIVGETTKNNPVNEAEENTTIHDQKAVQHLEKPKKMKRKGAEVMLDGIGVNEHALNEKKQKKVKSKVSKKIAVETIKNKPQNEAEENTTIHDQNTVQHSEKPQKIKQKRVKVMQDTNGVGDHAFNEKKHKKTKSKGSKEISGEVVDSDLGLKVNGAQQPQNETQEKTSTQDHNATKHLDGNQCSKVKQDAINSFEVVIPLPTGSELVTIAGVDLPKEDAGNALQLLEFCSTFGKILDVKKGQPEAVLRDLINGRSTRRGKFTSVIQFHIQLLSVIQEESGSESESELSLDLTHENDSWWKALKSCISKSRLKHMDSIEPAAGGYANLDASTKLRLLIFLCDEVLGTEKLRTWMDDQNVKFAEKRKEARDKLFAAKDKEKSLKQKMLDDVAKAVIANEGVPLTTMEYDAIVSKIKTKAAEAHAEMLECKTMVPIDKERPGSVRTVPIFRDNKGHMYWRLKGCSDKPGILLQDVGTGDHAVEVVDNWFEFDDEQMGLIENHINLLRSRFRKRYKTSGCAHV